MSEIGESNAAIPCGSCGAHNLLEMSKEAPLPTCTGCGEPLLLDRLVPISEADFEETVIQSGVPVLVDFYADWCGPCKILAPMLNKMAEANAGRVLFVKIDTDQAPATAEDHRIRGVPTVILFKNGVEVDRSAGIEPERLQAMLESV